VSEYLSAEDKQQLDPPEKAFASPIPTQVVSNREFLPSRQGPLQREVEARIKAMADSLGRQQGLSRRRFLTTSAGMAAAFVAMNEVYGMLFNASQAEAATPEIADARARALAAQFIVDPHTHYIHDNPRPNSPLKLFVDIRNGTAQANPELAQHVQTLDDLRLNTYVKELFLDSDTKIAALSGAPADIPDDWFLTNEQIAATRNGVNKFAGSKRLMSHFIFTPGQPGWLDAIDRGVEELRPDAFKGYTIGDNTNKDISRYPWKMDDEKLAYPAYEKFAKAGIRNVAIHKGIFTLSDQKNFPRLTEYARPDDVGKAAKDWPQLNFLIFHSAYRYVDEGEPALAAAQFEKTGRMDWVTDVAEIRHKYGVDNVYAEIGASFAAVCVSQPRAAAAMMGTLIKGLGVDHVLWGTDSIWFGSPQWQIEALRRLEIPEDMQKKHGFAPLGAADGATKNAIFGHNSARLFNLEGLYTSWQSDRLHEFKQVYAANGGLRSNQVYGQIRKRDEGGSGVIEIDVT
jgi:predicted TIM-barrel fold metal-dependent hydrolase